MRLAMNRDRRFLVRGLDQTKDLTRFFVVPILQILHVVLALRLEILLVRAGDGFLREAGDVIVYVNEQRHLPTPFSSVAAQCGDTPR